MNTPLNSTVPSEGDPFGDGFAARTLEAQTQTDALLENVNEQMRQNTFDASNQAVLKQLVESFADSRGMVRLNLAETLGAIGRPATPVLLEGLLRHSNPVVRRACAKTLTLIADPNALDSLLEAFLNDEDTVVRGSSVAALAKLGKAAVPSLLNVLAAPEQTETAKGHAAWALAFIGTDAKEQLYAAIASDSTEVRGAVVGAVANIAETDPEEKAFHLLINALKDSDVTVRSEAAAALGKLAYQPAVPRLVVLLNHSEAESRKAAAIALMKVGDPATLDSLKVALDAESEETVARAIALAISQLERRVEREN